MTIDSVLLNFRVALVALIPMVERAGILWRRPDAYDDWDTIASTLFEKLVTEVLRWSLPENAQNAFRLPSYDLLLPHYAGVSTLEVVHRSLPPGRWLFHAFGTDTEPFDVVEVRSLSADGQPLSEELVICPVDGARYCLRLDGRTSPVDEVDVARGDGSRGPAAGGRE